MADIWLGTKRQFGTPKKIWTKEDAGGRRVFVEEYDDPYMGVGEIHVNFTNEGIIVDLISDVDGDVVGTSSETYEELIERLKGV